MKRKEADWSGRGVDEQVRKGYESFGACLQRVLAEVGVTASEAARMVGFRSRNSIFRILNDSTSSEVDARFLDALKQAAGEEWQEEHWTALQTALEVKRVGPEQYQSNRAFRRLMYEPLPEVHYAVQTSWPEQRGEKAEIPLEQLLQELIADAQLRVTMCGCCERPLTTLLAQVMTAAGEGGQATVTHYIDVYHECIVQNLLGVLPLIGRRWYSPRMVEEERCTPEMTALYRVNMICIDQRRDGVSRRHRLIRYDGTHFLHLWTEGDNDAVADVLEKGGTGLTELPKLIKAQGGPQAFVDYTEQYARLEQDGTILSIKPDVHFNCVPSHLLYQAIMDGFAQAGVANGPELEVLLTALKRIHDGRYHNMYNKRKPTHLVYSIAAMERFMRTGVQTDQFFLQRAYTPQERKTLVREMYRETMENPFFNVYFLKPELPELRNEMTFYQGKGVLMLDAYTGYALHDDHSEALITLPVFMQRFQQFFMDELLTQYVLTKSETQAVFERLIGMED